MNSRVKINASFTAILLVGMTFMLAVNATSVRKHASPEPAWGS